jgi:hypothetical protein
MASTDLMRHQLPFQVRVGVVLAVVVPVLRDRLMRGEPLEPVVEVADQATLVVVDVDRGRDVHRVDEAQGRLRSRSRRRTPRRAA